MIGKEIIMHNHDNEEKCCCGCNKEKISEHENCQHLHSARDTCLCHKQDDNDHCICHSQSCNCHEHEYHSTVSCGCGCDSDHTDSKLSKILFSIGILLLVCAVVLSILRIKHIPTIFYAMSYLTIGFETFRSLFHAFREREFFGETTLMTVASIGAMLIGEMIEGCMVMLLFRIGEILEHKAIEKSENNIKKLLEMSPKIAERINNDGTCEKISPKLLNIGDIVLVKAGETIPCDGEVIEGCANTDTSSITGESVPLVAEEGSSVRCGYISLDSTLKVKVTVPYEDNSFSKIVGILSENSKKKSKSEAFITKFAKIYTPIVMVLALLVMSAGSIITGDISSWVYKGLVFLATSCPCAFVISVPLTFFFGAGEIAKIGLLVKGSEFIEKTSKINVVAFDKTGTLTKGEPEIVSVISYSDYSKTDIISYCASLERNSAHPLAVKIARYAEENNLRLMNATDILEIPGEGITGTIDGKRIKCGNAKMLKSDKVFKTSNNTTKVYVIVDDVPVGLIEMSDIVKPESDGVIRNLYTLGINRVAMLTGDNEGCASEVAEICGITETYAHLEPHEKTEIIERIKKENSNGITAFVGDGINDAPVLAVADVGIAVGSSGSDISVETADAVILGSTLEVLPKGIKCAGKIMARVKFNIAFAIIVKALIMILALLNIANMWIAVFGDVGVTVIVILNALRKIRIK